MNKNIRNNLRQAKIFFLDFFSSPTKVFVLLALSLGATSAFLLPAFAVPDEQSHFLRAYQISEGELISVNRNDKPGGMIPKDVNDSISGFAKSKKNNVLYNQGEVDNDYTTKEIDSNNKIFTEMPNTVYYSPIAYAPQVLGIKLVSLARPSVGTMVVVGRIFALAAFVLVVWLAIRVSKYGSWVYVVVGLFPITIQQTASFSADTLVFASLILFISIMHSLYLRSGKYSKNQLIGLLATTSVIALSKPTYLIVLLPLMFLPTDIAGGLKRKACTVTVIGLTGVILAFGWVSLVNSAHPNNSLASTHAPGINSGQQVEYLKDKPFRIFKLLTHTYIYDGDHRLELQQGTPDFIFTSGYGQMSWFVYKVPLWVTFVGYSTLVLALLYSSAKIVPSPSFRKRINKLAGIQLTVFALGCVVTAVLMYLSWTPVGSRTVAGIQGRYIVPSLPLLIPAGITLQRYISVRLKGEYVMGVIVASVAVLSNAMVFTLAYKWFH